MNASFFLAKLYKANLSKAFMGLTNFTGADLRKANFTEAEFDETTEFKSTQKRSLNTSLGVWTILVANNLNGYFYNVTFTINYYGLDHWGNY